MAISKKFLLYSAKDTKAESLAASVLAPTASSTVCASLDELRGRIEGGDYDALLVEPAAALKKLLGGTGEESDLRVPLAEVEKRHILRVLASTGGNKTQAARILGIDTKTLYNKIKAYQNAEQLARKRALINGGLTTTV